MRELPIIVGPTAAGKSALAMAIAEAHGAWIISADSRQVYRGFDIGTAKPTPAEQARVPHRGIDVAEPVERYSAARWAASVPEWIAEADRAGAPVCVVGGTGLYVRALLEPIFEEPPLDPAARTVLASRLRDIATDDLRAWVSRIDPARAHLGRTQLLRAIEVHELTGQVISRLHADARRPPAFAARYLHVDPGAVLRERIAQRVHDMLAWGWEAEVARLAATVPADAPAWQGCGYVALRDARDGRISRAAAIEDIVTRTRQYAKRQRTWFRHQVPDATVTSLDPTRPDALDAALAWWQTVRTPQHA